MMHGGRGEGNPKGKREGELDEDGGEVVVQINSWLWKEMGRGCCSQKERKSRGGK